MQHGISLQLDRCPHCQLAKPHLRSRWSIETSDDRDTNYRTWMTYECQTCGGITLAVAPSYPANRKFVADISDTWPSLRRVDDAVPVKARAYLEQAIASVHAPAGAVMLTASAVDAMLKEKGLKEGKLFGRIKAAAESHLITEEMAAWAHEIRLDANDQRHADDEAELPTQEMAAKGIEFATALAQFLFVLPSRVARGRGKG